MPSSTDLRLTKKLFSTHQKILRVKVNMSSILTSDQKNQNAFASKQLLLVRGVMMAHKWSLLELSELILQHLKVQWSNLPRIATDAFRYLQVQQSAILLGRWFEHSKLHSFSLHFENHEKLPKLFPNHDGFPILSRWIFITWWARKYGSGYWIRIGCF